MRILLFSIIAGVLLVHSSVVQAQFNAVNHSLLENPTILENTDVLVADDLDLDGDMDIVVGGTVGISWMENRGNCEFYEHPIIDYTFNVTRIEVIDFDKDGDKDLVANSAEGRVRFYQNYGNMVFAVRTVEQNQGRVGSIAVVDLDGDEDNDIISAWYEGKRVLWHENDGSENFTTRIVDEGVDSMWFCLADDFNNDGHVDIFATPSGQARLYLNDGNQNFTDSVIGQVYLSFAHPVLMDAENDQDTDIAFIDFESNVVKLFRNDGAGGFTTELISVVDSVYGFSVVDYDSDGDQDLISAQITNKNQNSVFLLQNNGLGIFASIELFGNTTGSVPEVADFSGNGRLDIVVGSPPMYGFAGRRQQPHNLIELFVQEDQDFSEPVVLLENHAVLGFGPREIADLDRDMDLDIFTVNQGKFYFLENTGNAFFQRSILQLPFDVPAHYMTTGDLTGNGHSDVWLSYSNESIMLKGSGLNDFEIVQYPEEIVGHFIADLHGDGASELVGFSGYSTDSDLNMYSYSAGVWVPQTIEASAEWGNLYEVDWDGDGDLDILKDNNQKITLLENDGSSNFSSRLLLSYWPDLRGTDFGDIDNDNDIDLVMFGDRGSLDNSVVWFENVGTDTLVTHSHSLTLSNSYVRGIEAIDIDVDGDMDILFFGNSSAFEILINDGNQNFIGILADVNNALPWNTTRNSWPFADLDGDGDPDFLVRQNEPNQPVWRENKTFVNSRIYNQDAPGEGGKSSNNNPPLAIDDPGSRKPLYFELYGNYPNPFNPTTTIRYSLPNTQRVTLAVYNLQGQRIRTLINYTQQANEHQAVWDGRNDSGEAVSSGVYFYRLTAGEFSESRKMVLLR